MSASSVRPRVSLATRSAADICAAVATGTSRAAIVGSAARLTSARRAQDDLEEIEAALVDAERIDRRLRSAAQHLACATCVSLRRARPREPRLGLDVHRAARLVRHIEAGLFEEAAPAGDRVLAHVCAVTRPLERVDESVECLVVGRVVVREHEPAARPQHAVYFAKRFRDVGEVMSGEATRRDVEGRLEEGERFGGRRDKHRVRDALTREQRARALEHAGRRVHADREPHACGDAAQRVADAASEVKRDLMRDGIRERQHRVEVLASRVRWALEVRLREWRPLTTRLVSHVTILTRMRLGRFQVEIFSDGIFRLDGGAMFGVVPKVLWEKQKPADELNRVAMDMNCLLIRDAGRVVLVETGAGPKLSEKQKRNFGVDGPPRLLVELAARGVKPDEVTLVVNTHLHFDHAGGNTYRDGERLVATFPRASYVFQRTEWEDAMAPNERTQGSYARDDYAPLEATGRLELVDDSVEILPGIRLDRVQGHTRGTQTVRVSAGRETLFFSSDFMPDRHHLPLPWIPAFDLYPLDTLAAKKAILARAVSERWIVAFTHDLPRFGRVSEQDGRYRFEELAS